MPAIPTPILTIGLLIASNVFMTFAWYGHLKFKGAPLYIVILVSWGIVFSAAQLKTIQEVITLSVFAIFSWAYLGEKLTWQHGIGFAFIALGAWFIFQGRG